MSDETRKPDEELETLPEQPANDAGAVKGGFVIYGTAARSSDAPTENVSLNYSKIVVE